MGPRELVTVRLYRLVLGALTCRRTIALEVFLALESLFCGLWILMPWFRSFGPVTLLYHVPEWATGGILTVHGLGATWAVLSEIGKRPRSQRNLDLCRRAAFSGAVLFAIVVVTFSIQPPRTLLIVPIVIGLVVAHVWIYLRLYLRFGPP